MTENCDVQRDIVRDGIRIPTFLYGTAWKEDDTRRLTSQALQVGFRGIDTANQRRHYVEASVGEALREVFEQGSLTRSDVFLQTKFTYARGQDHRLPYDPRADHATQVRQSFERSLEHLGTDYLDSFVLHGPESRQGLTAADWEVWRTMESLVHDKKVRLLGVSNVDRFQLKALLDGTAVRPTFVQNRCYARQGWDGDVRTTCREYQVLYQGFSLLTANPEAMAHRKFLEIASRIDRPPAQIIFRFALQMGMIPLTGTSNSARMQEDLGAYDFQLSTEEIAAIERISI